VQRLITEEIPGKVAESARPVPQPAHACGVATRSVRSGSLVGVNPEPFRPGWLPRLRSLERTRSDRAAFRFPFAASESCDGGLDEFVESLPNLVRNAATSAPARRSGHPPAPTVPSAQRQAPQAPHTTAPGWTPRHDLLPSRTDQVRHARHPAGTRRSTPPVSGHA
jgi:hypothetical protein